MVKDSIETKLDDTTEWLSDRDKVRQRPGMYIGDNGPLGLATIVREVIDNAIDEYPNFPDQSKPVIVTLHSDNSMTVRDHGRGISPYPSKKYKGRIAERLSYTQIGAGGKMVSNRNQNGSTFSAGLNGTGAAATNFMSEFFDVTIYKDGYVFHDRFENGGTAVVDLVKGQLPHKKQKGEIQTGTEVTFKADPRAMRTTEIDAHILEVFFRQMAYLHPGLHLMFKNERDGDEEYTTYYSENGLLDYMKELTVEDDQEVPLLIKPFVVHGSETVDVNDSFGQYPPTDSNEDVPIEMEATIAVAFSKNESNAEKAFTNGTYNSEGGTHVKGFRAGLTKLIRHYYEEFKTDLNSKYKSQITLINKVNKTNNIASLFNAKDLSRKTYVILDFKHSNPILQPQTKDKLASPEAKAAVEKIFYENAMRYLDKNIQAVQTLIGFLIKSLYEKAKENDQNVKLDKNEAKLAKASKLASARNTGLGKGAEIFLVEGDSAGGSSKENRDSTYQAVLPLRGKVLNVQKAPLSRALENSEISTIFAVLGAGFGSNYNEKKLQYDKVIIATDADSDGGHIRVLLATLFMKYMPELVMNGHLYILHTPLFVNEMKGKNTPDHYTYTNQEQDEFYAKNKAKIVEINRNKGLGELSKDQVVETILTPETRRLSQVVVSDQDEVEELINTLMGNNVQGRKRLFIDGE